MDMTRSSSPCLPITCIPTQKSGSESSLTGIEIAGKPAKDAPTVIKSLAIISLWSTSKPLPDESREMGGDTEVGRSRTSYFFKAVEYSSRSWNRVGEGSWGEN